MSVTKRQDLLLAGWCLAAVALGAWLRAQHLADPTGLAWDEHHFVRTAQNYLTGARDWNDHPPLGKLLIAQGIRWFGDDSWGWRASALASGWTNIALAGLLAGRLFRNWRAGVIAAALLAGDGFFIAYSRTALLDGVVATFTLATACAAVRARSALGIGLGAVLLGLGCAVKFSVVVMLVPLVAVALVGPAPRWASWLVLLAPLSYLWIYQYGLMLQHRPHGVGDVITATRELYEHHAKLTDGKHTLISSWYSWLLPHKPIPMRYAEVDGMVRSMTSMGNPLLWWAGSVSILATLGALSAVSAQRVRAFVRARATPLQTIGALDGAELWCLALWALPVLPWVLSRRDSYIYHYLPAYGFAVVLVAGKLARLIDQRRRLGWLGLGAVTLCAWWVSPVNAELPVTRAGYEARLWLPAWRRARQKPPAPPPAPAPKLPPRATQ